MVTIKSLLEKSIRGVIAQGKASTAAVGRCAYRGEGGTKCAVGMIISDNHYHKSIEGRSISGEQVLWAVEKSNDIYLTEVDIDYLHHVQCVHDSSSKTPKEFLERFKCGVRDGVFIKRLPSYCLDFLEEK